MSPLPEVLVAPATLMVVAGVFAAFLWERFPPEVVAVAAAAALLGLGVVDVAALTEVFANPAPVTIAAMFVLSGALVRTGAIDRAGNLLSALAARAPGVTPAVVTLGAMAVSAFVNNTPVVIVLIPVFMGLARTLGHAPSRLLIPLSYAAILGGTCTLIGTSTNLLVDGVARSHGQAPFGLFEITLPGLVMALAGFAWMTLVGARFLPDRETFASLATQRAAPRFLAEVVVPHGSALIGRRPAAVADLSRPEARVIDVVRGTLSLRRDLPDVVLQAGDVLVMKTGVGEMMTLREDGRVAFVSQQWPETVEPLAAREAVLAEGLVGPGSAFVGRRLRDLRIRRRFDVYPLAVHRHGENVGANLDEVVLAVGDTLLLEGAAEDLESLARESGLINLLQPQARAYRRRKAPIVLAVLAAVVGLTALDLASITALAIIGVAVVLLARCLDAEEAWQSIDWPVLILIYGMLVVGQAVDSSGAMGMVVDAALPFLGELPPWAVLAVVYALTSILTEIITNNAVAVLMTPLVIGLATAMGVDPRPFVVAVMFGASASFATPLGYQTNTMVYSAGGYRFADFLRIGVPMNLIVGIVALTAIPWFWPLH